jgi:hypothetical protein
MRLWGDDEPLVADPAGAGAFAQVRVQRITAVRGADPEVITYASPDKQLEYTAIGTTPVRTDGLSGLGMPSLSALYGDNNA